MLCPYCKIEYSAERPCFCHPTIATKSAETEERNSSANASPQQVAWNSHRGVRLD